MNSKGVLPPLPPSDEASFGSNRFDGFYKVRARDFWGDAEVHRIDDTPPVKCDHEFIGVPGGAKCQKCHFGLLGFLEVRDGKLFHEGNPIEL